MVCVCVCFFYVCFCVCVFFKCYVSLYLTCNSPKMLLAVDDFNACYNLTSFEHEKEKVGT